MKIFFLHFYKFALYFFDRKKLREGEREKKNYEKEKESQVICKGKIWMEKSMILSEKNAKWKRGAQWKKARKEHEPLWINCHFKNDDPWGSSRGNV